MDELLQENLDAILQETGDFLLLESSQPTPANLITKGNTTFVEGDILRIKDGIDDEWMEVLGVISPNNYVVERDKANAYGANANPTWKKGATIVNYKQSGDGGVYMTASEFNAPYLSIFDHEGSPWDTINTRLRLGNLNGFLGYSSDLYGIAIGETTKYLKYDTTNGLRISGNITILNPGDIDQTTLTNSASAGATVGATWGTNLSNIPTTLGTPSGTGLFLSATNMGYYTSGIWKTYMDSSGNFYLGGTSGKLQWTAATNTLAIKGSITASTIDIGNNGYHCDINGNIWWGSSATYAGATIKISSTGSVNLTTGTFSGELSAATGTLGKITAGTITGATITGGTIRTAESGAKVEMSAANNRLDVYNSNSTNIGWFGGAGNGNFININQPDTNEDYPPIFVTSAQASNVFNIYNTNSNLANRPAFRLESNNAYNGSLVAYIIATGSGASALLLESNSSSGYATLNLTQNGTSSLIATNVPGCYLDKAGTWNDASSKTLKENFENVSVLKKLKTLDILQYNYKVDSLPHNEIKETAVKINKDDDRKGGGVKQIIIKKGIKKHLTPMAEDFNAVFGLGNDDGISPADLAGVALQAIKELNQKVEDLQKIVNKLSIK